MTDLVFLDVETTGLGSDDDIWEFAAIRRTPSGVEHTTHIQLSHDIAKVAHLPESFQADRAARFDRDAALRQPAAAQTIYRTLAPSENGDRVHIVGANVAFDAAMIARLFRRNGFPIPPWHYHLIDVEAMALGYLAAIGGVPVEIPWRGLELSQRCGVTDNHAAHTALGDALWARDWYDVMTHPAGQS